MRTITIAGGRLSAWPCRIDVQKLIAKYGLAVHLALLAAVPVVLFPFFMASTVATVLLWSSLMAAVWTVLEPSLRGGERLSEARWRVARGIWLDPLFWLLLVIAVFSGFRALNTGIALSYDAESTVWRVLDPVFPILPGAIGGSGYLPFATAVAFLVLLQACGHSLGRSARQLFLLLSSALAGLAAVIDLFFVRGGDFGFVFGLSLVGGVISLVSVLERNWNLALFPAALAISGSISGILVFTPPHLAVVLIAIGLLTLVYVLVYSGKVFRSVGLFRIVLVGLAAFALGGLLVAVILPGNVFAERLAVYQELYHELRIVPERFMEIRGALSSIAFKSWISHLWIGTGLSSFPLDFRVNAQEADWVLFPRGATTIANGWWLLLAERGIVGFVLFALPFVFLLVMYVRRLVGGVEEWGFPHPTYLVAPIVFALFVADGFFDCSQLRAEVLLASGSLMAVSAASFPRLKRGKHGR